jgi:hypothetical protein
VIQDLQAARPSAYTQRACSPVSYEEEPPAWVVAAALEWRPIATCKNAI